MMNKKEIKNRVKPVLQYLEAGDTAAALALTKELLAPGEDATAYGTPVGKITAIAEEIGKFGQKRSDIVIPFLKELWRTGVREVRYCVGHAFGDMGKVNYREVLPEMYQLMPGVDWEALEAMAWGVGKMVSTNPEAVLPTLETWAGDENHWVRKSVSHAMVILYNKTKLDHLEDILAIMDILIRDHHNEVRKSIGFVFRSLCKKAPQRIVEFFTRWLESDDQYVRWNIANGSRNLGKEVLPVLEELARDSRKLVRRACASALKDIARKNPDVAPILESWVNHGDEGVKEVVAAALSYMKK